MRATFGFGDALIAMPLVAMLAGIKTATPLIAIIGLIISSFIIIRDYRKIQFRSIYLLIIFSILGIPIGLLYLKETNEDVVKLILATILILFSLYKIFNPGLLKIKSGRFSFIFGLIAGVLGGAYNTNGPPIIIYGTLRGWPPQKFRAILQGVFTPTNIFIVLGHGAAGLWTPDVFVLLLYSLPGVILAIIAGNKLNKVIPKEKFSVFVYYFLIVIGVILILNTLIL